MAGFAVAVRVFLPGVLFAISAVAHAGSLSFQVAPSLGSPPGLSCSGLAKLHRRCGTAACSAPWRQIAFAGANVTADGSVDDLALITFESRDCWIAPVQVSPDTKEIRALAWPPASIEGRLVLPDDTPIVSLNAHIKIDSVSNVVPQPCAVEGRHWICTIPATPLSARFELDGYAPRHIWNIHVPAGNRQDLGALEFRRGATITGSITRGSKSQGDIAVHLYPDSFKQGDPSGRTRTHGGHFEFFGIAPGAYRVVGGAEGFSPARSERIIVEHRSLYDVGNLRLGELAAIKVLIKPSVDAAQRPWTVALSRELPLSTMTTRVASGPSDPAGWWERTGLEAGVYNVAVSDQTGAVQHNERVLVHADIPVVEIHLSQIPFRGTLSLGTKATAGELRFSSVGLAAGKNVIVHADEDGSFAGWLPHEGKWNVRVRLPSQRSYVMKRDVEVQRRGDARHALVDVTLPAGMLKGTVVDDDGKGVLAEVMLLRDGRPESLAGSEEDGSFQFLGIAPGEVAVRATSPDGDSGLVSRIVSEADSPLLNLTLSRMRTVQGIVLTMDGNPLAGAALRYTANTMPGYTQAIVGPGGSFSLRVPRQTAVLTVVVLSVGMPVTVQTVAVDDEEKHLVVPATRGTLIIPMTPQAAHPFIAPPGGTILPMSALVFPPDGSGLPHGLNQDGFAIDLAAGTYTVCLRPSECRPVTVLPDRQSVLTPYEK